MTILALALASLFGAFSSSLSLTHRTENATALALAARSKLAEVGRSIPLQSGEIIGVFEQGGSWRLLIEEVSGPSRSQLRGAKDLRLFQIDLHSERAGGGQLHLSSMRLAHPRAELDRVNE